MENGEEEKKDTEKKGNDLTPNMYKMERGKKQST